MGKKYPAGYGDHRYSYPSQKTFLPVFRSSGKPVQQQQVKTGIAGFLLAVFLFTGGLNSSCSPTGNRTCKKFYSQAGKFVVCFCEADPANTTEQQKLINGYELTLHKTYVEKPSCTMAVEYFDVPEELSIDSRKDLYDVVIDSMAVKMQGSQLSKKHIDIHGYAGKEFSIGGKSGDSYVTVQGKVVLINKRLYCVLTNSKKIDMRRLLRNAYRGQVLPLLSWCLTADTQQPDAAGFLNSFELLGESDVDILNKKLTVLSQPSPARKKPEEVKWINGIWMPTRKKASRKQEMLVFATKGMVTWVADTGKELNGDYTVAENVIEIKFPDTVTGTKKIFLLASEDKKKLSSQIGITYTQQ